MLGNMSMFKDIGINVYKLRKKDGQYVYLGKYEGLSGDREAGIFEDNFDGKVFKLCSRDAAARLVYRNESYELYSVPVIMDGKNRYVRVVHSLDKDKYEIIGVWDGVNASNGKVGTFMDKVGIFDKITPVLPLYDELHENVSYIPGSFGMKLFGATGRKKAGRGEYIFEYELSDIYGVNRHGTPVNVRISGGKAHFE
jgi:hypothetical protein